METKTSLKLLIIAPSGIHLRNFLERVERSVDQIRIITSQPLIFETDHPVTFLDFSFKKLKNYRATPEAIREIYQDFDPDIIHVHQLNSFAFYTIKALKKHSTPIVATAWGSDVLVSPKKNFILRNMLKYILRNADAFTSDSAYMAQQMRSLVPRQHLDITICNFGVAKPDVSLPKENIIYTNRLHKPLYRVDKIIVAFKKFLDTTADKSWTLVIAAVGPQTQELYHLVHQLNIAHAVTFVGWLEREENMKWYARAKVWVSVPKSDATSISLLEAMYYGCFPVVVDLPVSHEWITHEENGRLVSNIDSPFLTGMEEIDFVSAAQNNRKIIEASATYAIAEAEFKQLYRKLLAR